MEVENVNICDPYGFIYITTNLVNGKRYLGQKKFDDAHKWKTYLGSGTVFLNAVKKYKKENFSRNIVHVCYSEKELNDVEYELSVFLNVVEDSGWYNLEYGGGGCSGYHHTEETKKHLSEVLSGENHPWYGKHHSEESKAKMSEAKKGMVAPNKGVKASAETVQKLKDAWNNRPHTLSSETKQKMRDAKVGKKRGPMSSEQKQKLSHALKGKFAGEKNPNYGKQMTQTTKDKISEKAKERYKDKTQHPTYGRHLSDAERQNLSEYAKKRIGEKNPNYGKGMAVVQLTLDGHFIAEYISCRDADYHTGVNHSTIYSKCKHKTKTPFAGGYWWISKEEYLTMKNNNN